MSRSRFALAVLLLAFAVVLWFWQRPSGPTGGKASPAPVVSAERVPATPAPEAGPAPTPGVAPAPTAAAIAPAQPATPPLKTRSGLPQPRSSADDEAVERDLTHVQLMFREYRDVLGGNPVGGNAEIMRAILGDNLKQAKIGAPEGQSMNGEGELLDRWGTPYFFHQVSKTEMEVRSAGPDRQMWTADDRQM